MKLHKKDIENFSTNECISWQYEHLEDKDSFGNSFDAIVTQNLKDKWLTIHLLRYEIGNDPQIVRLDGFWFIPDASQFDKCFYPFGEIQKQIKKKLKKDLKKKFVYFNDFNDSANAVKKEIENNKKLKKKNDSKTTN